jgi:hypothetical protein
MQQSSNSNESAFAHVSMIRFGVVIGAQLDSGQHVITLRQQQ